MLDLPLDIQVMIADYILTRADLKALCLTSPKFHSYIIPRLYNRIDLRTWDKAFEVGRLQRSVEAGAGTNLCHTRTLVIKDFHHPSEFDRADRHQVMEYHNHSYSSSTQEETDCRLLDILNMFPSHTLRRLCLLSDGPTSSALIEHLRLHQHNLEHLQCPSSPDLHRLYGGLTTLDVFYEDEHHLVHDFHHLHAFGKHIRRLSLTLSFDLPFRKDSLNIQTKFESSACMPNLKPLRLERIDLHVHYESLSRLVNFATLSHLSIMYCAHLDQFTPVLYKNMHTTELKLEHLATGNYMSAIRGSVPIELCLSAPNIRSLHCNLGCYLRPDNLLSLGPQLKMLSLEDCSQFPSEQGLYEESFSSLCDACPNLEQLGWPLPDKARAHPDDEAYDARSFMPSLKRLKNLRFLHLSVGCFRSVMTMRTTGDDCNAATRIQNIANELFAELSQSRACPSLGAIVISYVGCVCGSSEQWSNLLFDFCYIRGEQKDGLGRVTTVAVPISRALLLATQPCTSILDSIPGEDQWVRWGDRILV